MQNQQLSKLSAAVRRLVVAYAFSSALSYALERLGTPNLTTERRTAEVRRGGIPRKFCVRMVTDRIWQEHLLPSSPIRDRVQERATW